MQRILKQKNSQNQTFEHVQRPHLFAERKLGKKAES